MKIEIKNLPHTATLGKLLGVLSKYRQALGKEPTAYWLNASQWGSVWSGVKKLNAADAKAKKDPVMYVPVYNGIPVKPA